MILTDSEIRAACASSDGGIAIIPFDERSVEPASYDLRVGQQAATTSRKRITDLEREGFVEVEPGDFAIVSTFETLRFDNRHVGRFGLTSTHARRGLIATVGPQVDPGFHGRLTVGVTNLSTKPVTLTYQDHFLTVEFHRLEKPVDTPYTGQYQDRVKLSSDDIEAVMEREYMSQTEMMRTLQALVSTVDGLQKSVDSTVESLKQSVNLRLPLVLGGFLTLYTVILALLAN